MVSDGLVEKMAAATGRVGFTREQVLEMAKAEPRGATIFAGPLGPERPSRRRVGASSDRKIAGKKSSG